MCGDGEFCGPMDPDLFAAVLECLERAPFPIPQCAPALGVHQGCEHDGELAR